MVTLYGAPELDSGPHTYPGGCTCQGIPAQGGVPARGCTCLGVYLPRGVPAGGVTAQVLPPVNRMTDRCKNITLPQTSFAGSNFWLQLNPTQMPDAQIAEI